MVETAHLGGRVHQKARTRSAIVAAAHELAETGGEVTMPAIAAAARVSEATAYRYSPIWSRCCGSPSAPWMSRR